ncbi:flavin-containing monooxygenase [Acrocarpospora catenulata]|uniref:flavin-containing monooxygenase n=1 Tax=Acrocarpospora catenulata TaxID=2836182 RepID=UPI001BDB2EEC|nr:NAD(P)/FAD-dependent oxidoreductase [Acrocarpospora catenulata]
MRRADTVVVGAGHAGLAVSALLARAGRDHVVIERGRVAQSWRTRRWDSLRLLTPAWLSRLPGYSYDGPDPDAFLPAAEVAAYLTGYAAWSAAPVREHLPVVSVRHGGTGWRVVCPGETWQARHVVIASGHATRPALPAFAARLPGHVQALSPLGYRRPGDVAPGRVLVVGASASGVQIADELAAAGREVTLAAGRHTRLPRRYRGHDIMWWLDRAGQLDRTIDRVPDRDAARREPSMQLAGRADGRPVDLAALAARGVRLTGRVLDLDGDLGGGTVRLADDLPDTVADADRRLRRLLDRLDAHDPRTPEGPRPEPVPVPRDRPTRLDLSREGFGAVIWATGFRGDYSYLQVPGAVREGWLRQYRGASPVPGLFVIGQRFAHRRRSGFIDGARFDAADIVAAITGGSPVTRTHAASAGRTTLS